MRIGETKEMYKQRIAAEKIEFEATRISSWLAYNERQRQEEIAYLAPDKVAKRLDLAQKTTLGITGSTTPIKANISYIPPEERQSGIYFLFQNDRLIYIGYSRNMAARMVVHKRAYGKLKACWLEAEVLDGAEESVVKFYLLEMELYYIKKYTPIYNNSGYKERKPYSCPPESWPKFDI